MKQKKKTVMDQEIKCCDCGEIFEMSVGEIQWFHEMNYDLPRRCKGCRLKKKRRNESYYNNDQTCAGVDC